MSSENQTEMESLSLAAGRSAWKLLSWILALEVNNQDGDDKESEA